MIADIDADKTEAVMRQFIRTYEEPLFLILELPTKREDEEKLAPDGRYIAPVLELHGLTRVNGLRTAWGTFTRETYGRYEADDDRDVYSIVEGVTS